MSKYNLDKYFNDSESDFYSPKILVTILEDYLKKDFKTIKKDVESAEITITEEEICAFLERRFLEEEPETKESAQKFGAEITKARYCFEPYTLEYFNRYCSIVKNKAMQLLNIVERLADKDLVSIQDAITELDIQLDEKLYISREDIVRLLPPTLHNYSILQEKINSANNLETYLTFKMSKHSLWRSGCSEDEVYPNKAIFGYNLHDNYLPGNVPLSTRQKETLKEQQRKSMEKTARSLID